MTKRNLPKTDSIQKLAQFWDTHDLTDFDEELEEVGEPVFVRNGGAASIDVPLKVQQLKAIEKIAHAKGVSPQELVQDWVVQKLKQGHSPAPKRRSA